MIGDWLRLRYENSEGKEIVIDFRISQVQKFSVTGSIYVWSDERGNMGDIENHIEPIPITPEILLKNGFEFRGEGTARKPYQIIDDGLYISWWNNRLVIRYKRESGRASNYLNLDCRYVHDLQHCLRMAGIEKNITI